MWRLEINLRYFLHLLSILFIYFSFETGSLNESKPCWLAKWAGQQTEHKAYRWSLVCLFIVIIIIIVIIIVVVDMGAGNLNSGPYACTTGFIEWALPLVPTLAFCSILASTLCWAHPTMCVCPSGYESPPTGRLSPAALLPEALPWRHGTVWVFAAQVTRSSGLILDTESHVYLEGRGQVHKQRVVLRAALLNSWPIPRPRELLKCALVPSLELSSFMSSASCRTV